MLTDRERREFIKLGRSEGENKLSGVRYSIPLVQHSMDFYNDKVVADLGCGWGIGCVLMSKTAKEVIGIECNPDTYEFALLNKRKPNIRYIEGFTWEQLLEENSVDVVTWVECLEHMDEEEVELTIKEIKRILKPKGKIFITTTKINSVKDKERYPSGSDYTNYTMQEIEDMFEKHGFKLLLKKDGIINADRTMAFIFQL